MVSSSLDLLDFDYVISQTDLLTDKEFTDECEARRLGLGVDPRSQLEALHRAGVLHPFFCVQLPEPRTVATADGGVRHVAAMLAKPSVQILMDAREEGRLFDPRREEFRPWEEYEQLVDGRRLPTSQLFYSTFQLLVVPELHGLIARMARQRIGRGKYRYDVTDGPAIVEQIRGGPGADFVLHALLTLLEPRYLPIVFDVVSVLSDEVWRRWLRFRDNFSPVDLLAAMGWQAPRVKNVADRLLFLAQNFDPLARWHELARLVDSKKWKLLKGDARAAMDYRVAAEMLLLFYEDLGRHGEPLAQRIPEAVGDLGQRLSTTRTELDEVLMDFDLSPYPSLLMSLEGDTEMLVVPKVMELLDMRPQSEFIEFLDAEGDGTKFGLLATHVVSPRLGMTIQDMVLLKRPLTRLLVVRDPNGIQESGWKEEAAAAILEQVRRALPQEHRTPAMEAQLESLVFFGGWGSHSFEFAHFDDAEIARALLTIHKGAGAPDLEKLTADIARHRAVHGNLKSVWKKWTPKPSKVVLAEALWPVLKARIEAGLSDGSAQSIPVVRVMHRAQSLAREFRRADIGMRR